MAIDYGIAWEIVERFRQLDPSEAYYVKDEVEMTRLAPWSARDETA